MDVENLSLVLAADVDLTVNAFVAREALSAPYDLAITAVTPADNLPFEAIVGHKASFRVVSPWSSASPRAWTGIVHRIEQIGAEPSGLTTYSIHLAPSLWRLTRRTNCRIFQHLSIPEIAMALLAEWEILPELRLDVAAFPRHEYRVQYGETDLAFLSRLLEEAGITYLFEDPLPPKDEHDRPWSRLVLAEDATRREPRAASPEYWNTKDLPNDREALNQVRTAREVRPGRATLRDFDFRARPKHKLFATAAAASEAEDRIETYEYLPGAFVIEPAPDGARVDEREAEARAKRALAAARNGRFAVAYRANVIDLSPGVVFSLHGHPHPELGDKRSLLSTSQQIEGKRDGDWIVTGEATYGDEPHRPARITPRPRIHGVQSAFVVGPKGEEIHTDSMGRVRVELHWDREGKSDERSSCFVRVSQGWAGPGYGIVAVPRVGEEVLLSFFDGDPDQPVIVGRVHNAAAPPPQALPQNKTKTIWRTNSTPGGGGYNELALEDKKGEEVVALRAERDYERTVLRDERATIGASLTTAIGASEVTTIESDQTITVGGNRSISVAGSDTLSVGQSLSIDLGQGVGGTFSKDKKIILTTGEASLVLDGPNLYIDAKAVVSLRSGDLLSLSGGDVSIDGQPNINLNGSSAQPPSISLLDGALSNVIPKLPPGAPPPEALYSLINSPLLDPGQAPGELSLPPELEAQLAAARNKIFAGLEEIITKIENVPDLIGQDVLPEVEAAYAAAMARLEQARKWVEETKARIAAEIEKWKAEALALKARVETAIENIKAKVQAAVANIQAKVIALRDKARELLQTVKDTIAEYKAKIKEEFEYWKSQAIAFKNAVVGPFEEIRNAIKDLTQDVKDTISEFKQTITGIVDDVKAGIKDVKDTVQEVKDFLNDPLGLKEIKKDVQETIQGVKDAFNEAKQDAKEAWEDVKGIFDGGDDGDGFSLFSGENQAAGGVPGTGFQTPGGNLPGKPAGSLNLPGSGAAPGPRGAKVPGGFDVTKHASGGAARPGANLGSGIGAQGVSKATPPRFSGAGETGGFDLRQAVSKAGSSAEQGSSAAGGLDLRQAASRAAGSAEQGPSGGGFDLRQAISDASSAAGQGSSAAAGPPQNPLAGGTVVTRAGGLTPSVLADAVNAAEAPALLQSPGEGQLLVVRTQKAATLSADELTHAFVDGQMDGLSAPDAYTAALHQKGYLVYERPWDGWLTTFLKKAVL